MKILGFSEGYHDAAVTYVEDGNILYASHAERYSRKKNDRSCHKDQFVMNWDMSILYESPLRKNTRRLFSGQGWKRHKYSVDPDMYSTHHKSHAAAGYYTAPFDDCNIIVIDSIGEWDTVSIWDNMKKIYSKKYPYSLGLLYSAVTHHIGLKPNEDEYITMGMAAYGEPILDLSYLLEENNHKGILKNHYPTARKEDWAASVQTIYEQELLKLVDMCPKDNLIIMGGSALNCVANSKIRGKNIWIMPNPGDAGSSLGAAALAYGDKLNWVDTYLGYNIDRQINAKDVVDHLIKHSVCGVANGRAEFGPRALGNRSLLADPRMDIKDTLNDIKRRQRFRPFAPAILEEYADDYFEGPMNEYMQFTSKALHDHDACTHVDGTARVQVVKKDCNSIIRPILEEWYERTGCPMLINTSLNIKGQPIVNNWADAEDFIREYNVKVF
jgi:carbamoyltransferase